MQPNTTPIASNVSATTSGVLLKGGRCVLAISASSYGTTVQLQMLHIDGTWVSLNQTTFSQNQVTPFDLPSGQYRIYINGGTTTALYATLSNIPYG